MNDTVKVRDAHRALGQVGLSVDVVDEFVLAIKNLDQKPMRVTREQARVLAQHLAALADDRV